jgi:hypothetical protein
MRERGKISMQEQEGKTSRQKITNGGKETGNSRLSRADRRRQSHRCRERAEGHRRRRHAARRPRRPVIWRGKIIPLVVSVARQRCFARR